ncbi:MULTISPECIES: hypothetical protein [Paraburkholderia]|uniref:Cytochrome c domain-containing protein n=1 Tax=Paraburkholderia madseniana TaxID=2599607 RepID=A0AAP5ESR4_9BURK|nr:MULTISPECIES: hypothetical protein [Paraburkholderia]MCX4151458.1 hypothetical protein [Paraburkholderia madseniana]MDN7154389.1 hypothetical protein [Paraburkholderia sp. WS6]MDQ6413271.1 hypothetical protein [Paraburkholderia madseniana]
MKTIGNCLSAILLLLVFPFGLLAASLPVSDKEPGGTAEDTAMAIQSPYDYAWKLFFFLNRQAVPGQAGVADPSKLDIRSYDPDKPVVWETWALATGGIPAFARPGEPNLSEVYLDRGAMPAAWGTWERKGLSAKYLEEKNLKAMLHVVNVPPGTQGPSNVKEFTLDFRVKPLMFPIDARDTGEFEVRMNKSTYETIRNQNLYSVEGLEAMWQKAQNMGRQDVIKFDPASKEIKAAWIKLDGSKQDINRFHWRKNVVRNADGTTTEEIWGLVGLHIATKDLPQWFWADFEHVDCLKHIDCVADPTPETRPSVDPTTRGPNAPSGTDGVRRETTNSKWANYVLRGTQTSFIDVIGNKVEVSDTVIEQLSSGPSSCMTCHARASVGPSDPAAPVRHPPLATNNLGPSFISGDPDPNWFATNGKMQFIQTDFLWSMSYRAHSSRETTGSK